MAKLNISKLQLDDSFYQKIANKLYEEARDYNRTFEAEFEFDILHITIKANCDIEEPYFYIEKTEAFIEVDDVDIYCEIDIDGLIDESKIQEMVTQMLYDDIREAEDRERHQAYLMYL